MTPYLHPLPVLPTVATDDPVEVAELLADRWVLVDSRGPFVLRDPYNRPCASTG